MDDKSPPARIGQALGAFCVAAVVYCVINPQTRHLVPGLIFRFFATMVITFIALVTLLFGRAAIINSICGN